MITRGNLGKDRLAISKAVSSTFFSGRIVIRCHPQSTILFYKREEIHYIYCSLNVYMVFYWINNNIVKQNRSYLVSNEDKTHIRFGAEGYVTGEQRIKRIRFTC